MENLEIRQPIVSGQFYPSCPKEIKKQISELIDKKAVKTDCIGCILPHAGYIYSGKVAALTVSNIKIKNKVILLGPNHTGYGAKFSIMSQGTWQTPLGKVKICRELAKKMLKNSELLEENSLAHANEHSLEVELPILQYFNSEFEIVPIALLCNELNSLQKLGKEIANTIMEEKLKGEILLIASSDMTHYEPQEIAQEKDKIAIEAILELDETKLFKKVKELGITMCGVAPVAALIQAVKILGASKAKLIKYQTSGDATNDRSSVVGYAGIIIF